MIHTGECLYERPSEFMFDFIAKSLTVSGNDLKRAVILAVRDYKKIIGIEGRDCIIVHPEPFTAVINRLAKKLLRD